VKYYHLNVHNTMKINSNYPFPGFKVGEVPDPDIIIKVKKDINFSKEGLTRLDFWFYGKEGEDFVYYEDNSLGVNDKVLLKNLKGKTEIYMTKSSVIMDKFYVPRSRGGLRELINAIIQVKLIMGGYLFIHAACLAKDNGAILLASFPNTGKTLSTLQLLGEGYKYISEDTVLVHRDGYAYFSPTNFTVHLDSLKFIDKECVGIFKFYKLMTKTWIMKKIKFLGRILTPPKIGFYNVVCPNNMVTSAKVRVACCLEIGKREIKRVDKKLLANKILAINRYSIPRFDVNPFMWVYSYFNDSGINKLLKSEKNNLLNFLRDCDCYILSCEDRNWTPLIKKIMGEYDVESKANK